MSVSVFRDDCLKGRVALVTGGGSGIGFSIAQQLLAHGATRVMILGRKIDKLRKAAEALHCEYHQGDVRKPDTLDAALKKLGRLDIMVNCAAGNFLCSAEDLSTNGMRTVLDIDTMGTFNGSKAALPYLKESEHAVIINITATLHYAATFMQIHASAAKAACDAITRNLALEWKQYGIRVMGVAPGPIMDTPGLAKLAPGTTDSAGPISAYFGEKVDIAHACVYLASPAAKYVSGSVLVVDGGAWLLGNTFNQSKL